MVSQRIPFQKSIRPSVTLKLSDILLLCSLKTKPTHPQIINTVAAGIIRFDQNTVCYNIDILFFFCFSKPPDDTCSADQKKFCPLRIGLRPTLRLVYPTTRQARTCVQCIHVFVFLMGHLDFRCICRYVCLGVVQVGRDSWYFWEFICIRSEMNVWLLGHFFQQLFSKLVQVTISVACL